MCIFFSVSLILQSFPIFLKLSIGLLIFTYAMQMYGLCDPIPLEDAGIL